MTIIQLEKESTEAVLFLIFFFETPYIISHRDCNNLLYFTTEKTILMNMFFFFFYIKKKKKNIKA